MKKFTFLTCIVTFLLLWAVNISPSFADTILVNETSVEQTVGVFGRPDGSRWAKNVAANTILKSDADFTDDRAYVVAAWRESDSSMLHANNENAYTASWLNNSKRSQTITITDTGITVKELP